MWVLRQFRAHSVRVQPLRAGQERVRALIIIKYLVGKHHESEENWNVVVRFTRTVMRMKEKD